MSARALVSLTNGTNVQAWALELAEEHAVGEPVNCAACPLRVGGEWEAGLRKCLPSFTAEMRRQALRHSCHRTSRPCGGMRRLLRGAP